MSKIHTVHYPEQLPFRLIEHGSTERLPHIWNVRNSIICQHIMTSVFVVVPSTWKLMLR
jgi:hypothetical protein